MNEVADGRPVTSESAIQELTWRLKHIELSGVSWPCKAPIAKTPVLMIHGWLDNALSFARIGPSLSEERSVFAMDLAGHGQSGHRSPGQGYPLLEYVADLAELIQEHLLPDNGVEKIDLVGHSLGGIVAVLYAAAFPEKVRKLVMIDSLGPVTKTPEDIIPQVRKAIEKRMVGSGKPAVYPTVESAAKAREKGFIPLSHKAAMTLIPRNLKAVDGGYTWSTDAKLRHPSMLMMDERQVTACLAAVKTPTRFLRAEKGLLATRPELNARTRAIAGLDLVSVPGGHHCHLEGDVEPVINSVRTFLNNE